MDKLIVADENNIQNKIHTIRGIQVILDRDLAVFYAVKSIRLREQVKRNIARFPSDFMFQLTDKEIDTMVSQNAIPSKQHLGGAKPYVFSELGISMLSAVLKSEQAVVMSVQIIRAFVHMKTFITKNTSLFERLDLLEMKQLNYEAASQEKFQKIFSAIENKKIESTQGIFFDGQVFDAYVFISSLIKQAKSSIILLDNYIDETTLVHLSTKSSSDVKITILTKNITKSIKLDIQKYSQQYHKLEIKELKTAHDRFLLIDDKVYHLGASLKDLGKKWFAFSLIEEEFVSLKQKIFEVIEHE